MKTTLITLSLAVVLGVAYAALPAASRAEDATASRAAHEPTTPQELLKAIAEAGKPGLEHKKLEALVGEWDVTLKLWTDPSKAPAELKGTSQRKWIMGGRFISESCRFEIDGAAFEGLGLVGYDKGQKKYTFVRACELCGTIMPTTGTLDAAGTRLDCPTECTCPLSGKTVKGHDEMVIESNDRIVVNVWKTIDGKEMKMMEIVSTRRK